MSNLSSNNKRIAKNTLFLYVRMLFLMFISLYTSRVVLDKLGVEDFGIFNVVGGLATMFTFFSSSLSNATQRFLNIELGQNNLNGAKKVFSQYFLFYCIIAIVVIVAAETIGSGLYGISLLFLLIGLWQLYVYINSQYFLCVLR